MYTLQVLYVRRQVWMCYCVLIVRLTNKPGLIASHDDLRYFDAEQVDLGVVTEHCGRHGEYRRVVLDALGARSRSAAHRRRKSTARRVVESNSAPGLRDAKLRHSTPSVFP